MDAFFFKFCVLSWVILCAISQSTYFAVSNSGRLDHILDCIKLSDASATYVSKVAVTYTSIAWVMILITVTFTLFTLFFTGRYMDVMLAPITTHTSVSDLLIPRIAAYLFLGYCTAAWMFPHVMSFMLATIFTHQYKLLSRSFDELLAKSDECPLSDSDIETLRQRHQQISMSISEADDFLMFHNVGAFCCQLLNSILHLYDLIFFHDTYDPVVFFMLIFWMFGMLFGLTLTTAGGMMINHYVSRNKR